MATLNNLLKEKLVNEHKWYKSLITVSYIIASLFLFMPAVVVGFLSAEVWAGLKSGKHLWDDVQQWCAKNI